MVKNCMSARSKLGSCKLARRAYHRNSKESDLETFKEMYDGKRKELKKKVKEM